MTPRSHRFFPNTKKPQKAPKDERKPLVRKQLELEEVLESIGRREKDRSSRQGRPGVLGEIPSEQEHAEAREHERREEGYVVGERQIFRREVYGPDERGYSEKVLGVGQGVGPGSEDVRIEERKGLSRQDMETPSQSPGIEKRVGAPAEPGGEPGGQGPSQPDRDRDEKTQGSGKGKPISVSAHDEDDSVIGEASLRSTTTSTVKTMATIFDRTGLRCEVSNSYVWG